MEFNKKNVKNILILAVAIIAIYQIFDNVNSIIGFIQACFRMIFPFILGLGIAFIFNVPMRFVENLIMRKCSGQSIVFKKRRIISFFLTFIFLLGILFLVAFLVIPQLTVTITQVIDQIPAFGRMVEKWLQTLQDQVPKLEETIGTLEARWDVIEKALSKLSSAQIAGMFNSTVGIISNVVSGITTFFIAVVFAGYVIFQKETLCEQSKKFMYAMFPVKVADRIINVVRMADESFSNFLVGQCTEAFILGMMFVISMGIFKMPYNVMIGVLIAVMSLIPIVGAFIGCFVGAFLILMVDPMQAVFFIILFLVIQQIEGNFIYPHVVGNSVGLPSIWVLAAVTLGGNLMGVAGMIIGIPIVSILYTLLARYVNVRLMTKKVSEYKWRNKPNPVLAAKSARTKKEKAPKSNKRS